VSVLQCRVKQSMKRIVIFTLCHILEFQKILDSNFTRIGLSIYAKFRLGKWLGTHLKIIQNCSQKTQNHTSSYWVCDKKTSIITVFAVQKVSITKEIKNASECIVELYKHTGIFKNTREVHREARGAAEYFLHFLSVLKNSQVLI